jgi:hypothetical protein
MFKGEHLKIMQHVIICHYCRQHIGIDLIGDSYRCDGGHEFPVIDGIIDLLPNIENDKSLLAEEQYCLYMYIS